MAIEVTEEVDEEFDTWRATQVNPPIHVVVENGHVTLAGVVNSEVERRKAETVARATFGVLGVTNSLRLDSDFRSMP